MVDVVLLRDVEDVVVPVLVVLVLVVSKGSFVLPVVVDGGAFCNKGYEIICTRWRNCSKSSSSFAKASISDFFARITSAIGAEIEFTKS